MSSLPALLELYERGSEFCGRDDDLRALERAWERALESEELQLALVSGEPGVGKTRLLARLATRVADGDNVLYGRCREEAETSYAPLTEALEPTTLTSGFDLRAEIVERLAIAGASRPVLLLIDDLHWIDRETLRLLADLLEGDERIRGLMVLTFRDAEVDEPGHLASGLHRLRRRPGALDHSLSGLAQEDLAELAASLSGPAGLDLDAELLQSLAADTGGNPLFATELLRNMIERAEAPAESDPAERLPATVTETIRQRVGRLGDDVAEALTVAAICGAEFDVELLRESLGWSAERLDGCLGEAQRAKLLEQRRRGALGFSHTLVARSLTERAGVARRSAIHRSIGEALERLSRYPGDASEALARHWLEASPPDYGRAIGYSHAAGRRALTGHRIDAARKLFGAALSLHDGTEDALRAELLLGLGQAQRQAAESVFGRTLLESARVANLIGEVGLLNSSLIAAGRDFDNALRSASPERIALLRLAIASTPELDPAYPMLLAALASELTYISDERFELSDRAVEAARRLGDTEALAWVLIRRFMTIWTPDTLDERLANAAEAVELADRIGDPVLQFQGTHWYAVALLESGEFERGIAMFERERAIATRYGRPIFRFIAAFDSANLAILRDDVERADALATRAFEIATDISFPGAMPYYGSQICNVRYQQGRLGEIRELLAQMVADYPTIPSYRPILALSWLESGLPEGARSILMEQMAEGFDRIPRDLTWLPGMVCWGHVCAELGEREAAVSLLERLDPYAGRPAVTGGSTLGEVDHARGRLAALLGRREAADLLERACQRYEEIGAVIWLGRARAHLAELRPSPPSTAGRNGPRRNTSSLSLREDDGIWSFSHHGFETRVRASVGMEYLARLLAGPRVEVPASDLQSGGSDGTTNEQARINVTRAIRRAIGQIRMSDPALAAQLDRSIRTGTHCLYAPPEEWERGWLIERG